jgi:predicted cupin superfamily sugar epimerase
VNPSDSRICAQDLVELLHLEPHPEGGWYREIHRSADILATPRGPRAALTSIYFLLERSQFSRWHAVASDETWHFAYGAPLELLVYSPDSRQLRRELVGSPQGAGDDRPMPTGVVRAGQWQAARSLGEFTLVGCDVAPGFDFEDFEFIASRPGHEAHFIGELAPYLPLL